MSRAQELRARVAPDRTRRQNARDEWRVIVWQFGSDEVLADETRTLATTRWNPYRRDTHCPPFPRSVDMFGMEVIGEAHGLATVDASLPSDRRTLVGYEVRRNGVLLTEGVSSRPVSDRYSR